jgi:hypothetical protein
MASNNKPQPKEQRIVLNRSSETGRFVTESYAKRHPANTEREVRKIESNRTSSDRSRSR